MFSTRKFLLSTAFAISGLLTLSANDGAAEVGVGGIRLRHEKNVAMQKERLFISKKRVRVEYEFLNETEKDVTSDVAFPIPPFGYPGENSIAYNEKGFRLDFKDFRVEVDGKHIPYQTEVRGLLNGKDVTDRLRQEGIDIRSFAGFKHDEAEPGHSKLDHFSKTKIKELVAEGFLLDEKNFWPQWQVCITYYWSQTFPAHKVLRIAHEYRPAEGETAYINIEALKRPSKGWYNESAEPGCPDDSFKKAVELRLANRAPETNKTLGNAFLTCWVRYILTTATTWKGPIRDFELVVERDPGELVTFCWDGPVVKAGPNTYRASATNFVPSRELTIYFSKP